MLNSRRNPARFGAPCLRHKVAIAVVALAVCGADLLVASHRDRGPQALALPAAPTTAGAPSSLRPSPAPPRAGNPCHGRLPSGYRIERGYPARSDGLFNPQGIGLFMAAVFNDGSYSPTERRCLMEIAANALLAGARRRNGAMLLPYPFPFDYRRLGVIQPPWFSALAQSTVAGGLYATYLTDGDPRFERAARQVLESLALPRGKGGFLTPVAGGLWAQEYPTSTPSYVLNGHLYTILGAYWLGRRLNDPLGTRLLKAGARAASALLPLFDVPTPTGEMSSYDLVRRSPGAPLRVVGSVGVQRMDVVDRNGRVLSSLDLRPAPAPGPAGRGSAPATSVRASVVPSYPISVLDVPRVFVRVRYSGSGELQAFDGASWMRIAALPSKGESATVEVPAYLQGREVSLEYHRDHVRLLRWMFQLTGDRTFRDWANRWQR